MQENDFDGEICLRISSKWEETEYVFGEGGKPIQNVEFGLKNLTNSEILIEPSHRCTYIEYNIHLTQDYNL